MGHNRSRSRERRKSRDRSGSRDHRRRDRSRSRDRKRRQQKSRTPERRHKDKKHREHSRERRRDRSTSRERTREHSSSRSRRHRRSSSSEYHRHRKSPPKVKVLSLEEVMRKKKRNEDSNSDHVDHRKSFHISDEFSQEDFTKFSLDHGIDLTNIETDEDRGAIHEKMEEVLKAHFAAQGKVYPPPKVEKPAVNKATGFANDGSFLEQFKKMQDDYKKQTEDDKKRRAAEERLKSLPIRRRGGGKILKTGVVAKTKIPTKDSNTGGDSFSSYLKEVQKYKTACDADTKTRPLVK